MKTLKSLTNTKSMTIFILFFYLWVRKNQLIQLILKQLKQFKTKMLLDKSHEKNEKENKFNNILGKMKPINTIHN